MDLVMDLATMTAGRADLVERLFREVARSAAAAGASGKAAAAPVWRFPELPGWRVCNGSAGYFGPVSYEGDDGEPAVGPGSIAIGDGDGSTFEEEQVQAVWERWTAHERDVYVEARGMAAKVAEACLGAEGAKDHGVRLLCARFGVNRVQAFRLWFGKVRRPEPQAAAPRDPDPVATTRARGKQPPRRP